jgi:ribose transport system permease protein
MAGALVVLCAVGAVLSPQFLTASNAVDVAQQVSLIGIMAVGMTYVIVSGEIDLSVGSIYALASVVTAQLLAAGRSAGVSVAAGLVAGVLAGACNGLLAVFLRIPSFIVTLGSLSVYRGISLLATDGAPISLDLGQRQVEQFAVLGGGRVANIPVQVLLFGGVLVVGGLALARSRLGYHLYAVGGSPQASRLCGINVAATKVIAFAVSGLCAALAGVVGLSFLLYVQGVSGQGLELGVITAVIVGGAALFGGSGTVAGTLVGVLIIGLLNNILVLKGVSSFWQTTVVGVVIVAAVAVDAVARRRNP